MKILIVEDEPLELRALSKLIELSYPDRFEKILYATDGLEAVRKAKREKPDLLLMDINLPLMNGIQAMKKIRENQESTKFIMISAYSSYEYLREAVRNQAIDYILKPISEDRLAKTMDKIVNNLGIDKDEYYAKLDKLLLDLNAKEMEFNKRISVYSNGKLIPLDTKDIIYATVEDKNTVIISKKGKFQITK